MRSGSGNPTRPAAGNPTRPAAGNPTRPAAGKPTRPAKVVLAKPGLDGHDRGVKVVGMALRDAGAEVVYLGLRQSADQIVAAARAEDADVIGISVLSGVHIALARQIRAAQRATCTADIPLVVGGTIPPEDVGTLTALGVCAVFGVGTPLDDVVCGVLAAAAGG